MAYLAARYFAPRYFAPAYFATRRPVAPVAPVARLPGIVLSFPTRPRIFRAVARGGLIAGGAAQTMQTFDRWAKARAEDELWLLML